MGDEQEGVRQPGNPGVQAADITSNPDEQTSKVKLPHELIPQHIKNKDHIDVSAVADAAGLRSVLLQQGVQRP